MYQILSVFKHINSFNPDNNLILQMRKLRPREVKKLAQGLTALSGRGRIIGQAVWPQCLCSELLCWVSCVGPWAQDAAHGKCSVGAGTDLTSQDSSLNNWAASLVSSYRLSPCPTYWRSRRTTSTHFSFFLFSGYSPSIYSV